MRFFWQRDKHDQEERHSAFSASSFSASSMALLMVAPTPTAVATEQAKMTVSATVLKHASLRVLAQPSSVVVTPEDVARGYVDVAAPTQLAIKCNSGAYMLVFAGHGEFVRQILVSGLGNEVQMGADGGAVKQVATGRGMTTARHDVGLRFELSAAAREGVYPWPLQISVEPL